MATKSYSSLIVNTMVHQRGREFDFLLEQEKFVFEHESSCSSTTILCPSKNFVLWHEMVVPGHDLVCVPARNVCARARSSSCSSTKYSCSSTNLIMPEQEISCSSTNYIVLEHKVCARAQTFLWPSTKFRARAQYIFCCFISCFIVNFRGFLFQPNVSSSPYGYLYEFDCKPTISSTPGSDSWTAIAIDHKVHLCFRDENT